MWTFREDDTNDLEELPFGLNSGSSKKELASLFSQPAYEVIDFSSQYGSENALSYTADNILGATAVYPFYGDHAHSFHFRTYGKWSQLIPSYLKTPSILPTGCHVESQDFIEFRIKKKIRPVVLQVYETYNPGALVKVFGYCYRLENCLPYEWSVNATHGCTIQYVDNLLWKIIKRWVTLWRGEPAHYDDPSSICFSVRFPPKCNLNSDYFRMEFHHNHLKYFYEIDSVTVTGDERPILFVPSLNFNLAALKNVCIKENFELKDDDVDDSKSCFHLLPEEITCMILSYLDLQSLCKASSVSKFFQKSCYDPLLYRQLNLQLYWHLVNNSALKSLQPRLLSLDHLDLSWCGGQNRITAPCFIQFIESSCKYLTILKVSCCPFINNKCMKALETYCPNLTALEMRCCRSRDLTKPGFKSITQLQKLKYLDLYRTHIDTSTVLAIIKSCTDLEHLFLGSCTNIRTFDEVAQSISKYLKNIKTLDFWRSISLTCLGVCFLAEHCHSLVELDLGWCRNVDANCGCLEQLISRNVNLKKLFLPAIRTVSNNEVDKIAKFCKNIELLDIMGTNEVNVVAIQKLLESCSKLKLLDVSYCDTAVREAVPGWEERFPAVDIKCSIPIDALF